MTTIAWDDRFSVGNADLDEDHKILLDLVNQIHQSYAKGIGRRGLETVLELLTEYTDGHFEREEAFMESLGYPGLEEHRSAHKVFRDDVQGLRHRLGRDDPAVVCKELIGLLNNWWRFHILEADMAYYTFAEAKVTQG